VVFLSHGGAFIPRRPGGRFAERVRHSFANGHKFACQFSVSEKEK
jgi:hypothetical protein